MKIFKISRIFFFCLIIFSINQNFSIGKDVVKFAKKELEKRFVDIQRLPKERKLKEMFIIAESLQEVHKGWEADQNSAFLIDFYALLDTIPLEQKHDILRYFVEHENCVNYGSYIYNLSLTGNIDFFKKILKLFQTEKDLYAISALGYYNQLNSIAFLLNLLMNDELPKVRYMAAVSLGNIGNKIAIPFLKEALMDEEDAAFTSSSIMGNPVSESALQALNKITGKKLSLIEWRNKSIEKQKSH